MIHSSKSLATQVAKVKRISVTGICLPDHFGGFFQKLKILRLKLGLFSRSDWISGRAIPPVSWGKEVKSTAAVNLATCMFLTASAKRCCCPQLSKKAFRLCGNFLGNREWLHLKSPSWWSAFGQHLEQKGTLQEELDKYSLWSAVRHICSLALHLLPLPDSPPPWEF